MAMPCKCQLNSRCARDKLQLKTVLYLEAYNIHTARRAGTPELVKAVKVVYEHIPHVPLLRLLVVRLQLLPLRNGTQRLGHGCCSWDSVETTRNARENQCNTCSRGSALAPGHKIAGRGTGNVTRKWAWVRVRVPGTRGRIYVPSLAGME